LTAAEVVGTDLVFGLALSLAGGGIHAAMGSFNGAVLARLLAGGAVGALTGTALSSRIPARPLRLALLVVMAILGAQIAWKGLVI